MSPERYAIELHHVETLPVCLCGVEQDMCDVCRLLQDEIDESADFTFVEMPKLRQYTNIRVYESLIAHLYTTYEFLCVIAQYSH